MIINFLTGTLLRQNYKKTKKYDFKNDYLIIMSQIKS